MPLLFLSHSSVDNAHALAIAQWLEGNGWTNYFLDISESRGLNPGEEWQNSLRKASDRCEAVVFLVSRPWLDSKWCLAEFLLAKQLGKKIFGVLIEDIPIGELPHELTSEWQLCDLVHGDKRVLFDVERPPFVPASRVDLSEVGLAALKRGLKKAGLEATTFPWPPANELERAPYRGLKPYEAIDAAIFFGRDADIVRGLDQVRQLREQGIDKLLVILGSSGAGKSSFMRAGLWPRLNRDDHHFYTLPVVRPGRAAINGDEGLIKSIAFAMADVGITTISLGEIRTRFQADETGETLLGYLHQIRDALAARALSDTPEPTFILPVDQGEELYGNEGIKESVQLRAQLACLSKVNQEQLGREEAPKLIAVVTIRTDLYGHLQSDQMLRDVGRQMIDLTPMDRAQYKRVIEGPAERATEAGNPLRIDPALAEQLLTDTHGADALPMLAFTLERMYSDYGADGDLTIAEYDLLGGVAGSLMAAINDAMDSPHAPPAVPVDKVAQQRLLKQTFIPWLAEVDEQNGERRRRVADWNDLPPETHPILERLTRARLLVRDRRDIGSGEKRVVVEVAHEALLRRWPALVNWLDSDQDALKAVGSVSRAAEHWSQNHRDDEYLIHAGERLRDAESLLERADFAQRMQSVGCQYLARCRAVEDARRAKDKRQSRRLRVAFALALLLAVGAGFAALKANDSAIQARKAESEALTAKQEAVPWIIRATWRSGAEYEPRRNYVTGVRKLIDHADSIINLDKLRFLAPTNIFLSGPHRSKFDWEANDFGRYNPDFVTWMNDYLIPGANDLAFRKATQSVYDKHLMVLARAYCRSYQALRHDPTTLSQLKANYLAHLDARETGNFFNGGLISEYSTSIEYLEPGLLGTYAHVATGFWIRRELDGTADEFDLVVRKLLRAYDPDYAKQCDGYTTPFMDALKDALPGNWISLVDQAFGIDRGAQHVRTYYEFLANGGLIIRNGQKTVRRRWEVNSGQLRIDGQLVELNGYGELGPGIAERWQLARLHRERAYAEYDHPGGTAIDQYNATEIDTKSGVFVRTAPDAWRGPDVNRQSTDYIEAGRGLLGIYLVSKARDLDVEIDIHNSEVRWSSASFSGTSTDRIVAIRSESVASARSSLASATSPSMPAPTSNPVPTPVSVLTSNDDLQDTLALLEECRYGGQARTVTVEIGSPDTGFACQVTYATDAGTKTPWTARQDADYCLPKARALLQNLEESGWVCSSR